MNKFFPIAMMAILLVGCKGGDTTSATTGSGGGSANQTHTIKMNPKQGDKYPYLITQKSGDQNMEIGMTMACEKAEANKFTMVTTFDAMKMNGQDAPAMVMDSMKKMRMITVMDATGKALETKVEGAPAGTPTPDSSNPSFPPGPVKVGDTWEGSAKVGGSDVKYTYKLTSVANEGGMEVATMEATASGLPEGGSFDGPMVVKIEMATGMPVSMSMKTKSKNQAGKEVVGSMEMKRR